MSGAAWSGLADVVTPGADATAAASTSTSARCRRRRAPGPQLPARPPRRSRRRRSSGRCSRASTPHSRSALSCPPSRRHRSATSRPDAWSSSTGGTSRSPRRARRPRSRWGPDRVQLDARKVREGSTMSADVCVIGAGAAGITVSRALAAKGHHVLLLESGGFTAGQGDAVALQGHVGRHPDRPDRRPRARHAAPAVLRRNDQPLGGILPAVPRGRPRGTALGAALGMADHPCGARPLLRRCARRHQARTVRLLDRVLDRAGPSDATLPRRRRHAARPDPGGRASGARGHVPRRDRGIGSDPVGAVEQRHASRARRERRRDRPRRRRDAERQLVPRARPTIRAGNRWSRGATGAPHFERPPSGGHRQRTRPGGSLVHGAREHRRRARSRSRSRRRCSRPTT